MAGGHSFQNRAHETKAGYWKWVGALGFLGLVYAMGTFLPVSDWILQTENWFESRGPWGPFLYCVVFVLASLAFLPTSILMIGAGLFFGPLTGTIVSSVACVISAALNAVFIRKFGGIRLRSRLKKNRIFDSLCQVIENKGVPIVVLLRVSPLPFAPANCMYAVTGLPMLPYLSASWLGLIPSNLVFTYLGATGGKLLLQGGERPMSSLEVGLLMAGGVIALAVFWYVGKQTGKILDR